jgi:hypothetical protein
MRENQKSPGFDNDFFVTDLLNSRAEKGEKPGHHEEPHCHSDVDDIHRLLLPIVSNFDSGSLYIGKLRSWVIKKWPKRVKIVSRS